MKKYNKIFLVIVFILILICCAIVLGIYSMRAVPNIYSPTKLPTIYSPLSNEATVSAISYQLDQYFNQHDFYNWEQLSNQMITLEPDNYSIFYYRSNDFRMIAEKQFGILERMEYYSKALSDIDRSLSLYPSYGDSYLLRAFILHGLADGYPYRSDREIFNQLALENIKMGALRGSGGNLHPERQVVIYETYLHQCDNALKLTDSFSKILPEDDVFTPTLETMYELSYACKEDYEKALFYNQANLDKRNMSNEVSINAVIYLYQLDRKKEALTMASNVKHGLFACKFKFMKALIEFDFGQYAEALQDADLASRNCWQGETYNSYIEGLNNLRLNQKDKAIKNLQYSEATFDYDFYFLIQRSRNELRKLNQPTLVITPSVHISSTPIPYQ